MLENISGARINLPLNITAAGDNIVIAGQPNRAIFIHEFIGDLAGATSLTIKNGAATSLALFTLADSQGITLSNVANLNGEPRFVVSPGNDFIINLLGAATFNGNLYYSWRD
jgi:hypothetical protein